MGLVWLWQQWPDGKLRVVFCDVGQGDAAIVILGSFQALIDTGPSPEKLFLCLGEHLPFWDRKIELVFISHPQKDHNGALLEFRERFSVGMFVEGADQNDIYRYKDLYFDILSSSQNDKSGGENKNGDENEDSVVLQLRYRDFSSLFTADIGEKTELALIKQGVLRKLSVLKVAHHGSKFSSSEPFLEWVRPKLAVVSVGSKNSYGHPHESTLMRLDGVGSVVLRTDKRGSVEVVSDGKTMSVFASR